MKIAILVVVAAVLVITHAKNVVSAEDEGLVYFQESTVPESTTGSGGPESTTGSSVPESTTGSGGPESTTGSGVPESTTGSGGPESTTGSSVPESTTGSGGPESTTGSGVPESTTGSGGPESTTDDGEVTTGDTPKPTTAGAYVSKSNMGIIAVILATTYLRL